MKRAAWFIGICLFLWAASACVEFNGPAVDNPPRYQEGEFDDDYRYRENQGPTGNVDINEDRGPEPSVEDKGAYDWGPDG